MGEINDDSSHNVNGILHDMTDHTTSATTSNVSIDINASTEAFTEAERNLQYTGEDQPHVYKFVFTGGPCGGKTTALARIFSFLRERNFEVINCPEAYTILNSNGMSTEFFTTPGMDTVIQGCVMDCQITFENSVTRVLQARGKPAIMLCDRGLMDGSIFVSTAAFAKVLQDRHLDVVQARDNRYDAIFHLVTAADGAEHYYTLENNPVRWESKEQARLNDKLIQKAWVGHPHLYVIDNTTDFEGKMNRVVDIICKLVGLPSNLQRRSTRFLVNSIPDVQQFPADVKYQIFDVEKVYLRQQQQQSNDNNNDTTTAYSFIRRRTNIDPITGEAMGSVYQRTTVNYVVPTALSSSDGDDADNDIDNANQTTATTETTSNTNREEIIEQKRIITRSEYDSLYTSGRDVQRYIVKQRRISFLYAQQSFNIHIYQEPSAGLCILHAQVEANKMNCHHTTSNDNRCSSDGIILPPFLQIDRQLNDNSKEDDAKYGAYSLSIIQK